MKDSVSGQVSDGVSEVVSVDFSAELDIQSERTHSPGARPITSSAGQGFAGSLVYTVQLIIIVFGGLARCITVGVEGGGHHRPHAVSSRCRRHRCPADTHTLLHRTFLRQALAPGEWRHSGDKTSTRGRLRSG
jgi:hypothetical protein